MAAYIISEVEMLDGELGSRYRSLAAGSIAAHGGRYVVRGALPDALEGDWPSASRLVVVEFPSMEVARRWYASAEYAEALALSRKGLRRRLILCEALPPDPSE
ncbi:MAG TPA: DUF1330 domain-containing protein [Candidatus Dormibacteraeota bacterium]|jgi:uncharacterized protein (DUF1330 family)|nr:DUF1330 domain-containing protein [Candidatus Dormibacteraeota bacterium]